VEGRCFTSSDRELRGSGDRGGRKPAHREAQDGVAGARPETVAAGGGRSPVESWNRQRQRDAGRGGELGLEALFLKRDMGAPDSLQCLAGAHRTAHSSCPVNHRTAHRKTDF
jgi:hypothetical protein